MAGIGSNSLSLAQEGPHSFGAAQISADEDRFQQLLRQVNELERKLKALEDRQALAANTNNNADFQELDQKVRVIERTRELEKEAAETKAKESPRVSIGEKGFSFASPDTNFVLQLKGVLQVDSRTFFGDSGVMGNDGFLLRRARPILQGTVFGNIEYQFVPDFGGSGSPQIYDAFINYRYAPALKLQAGKFKSPVGLEQLQSDKDILFNERALPTDLLPNRDIGFQVHGDLFGGAVSYAAGIFNGVGDARNSSNMDIDDNKSFAGRIFVHPWKGSSVPALQGLGFGAGGSYEDMQGTNITGLPNGNGFATPGQERFFTYRSGVVAAGNHWRVSPQGYYYYGPFNLLGEYVISDQEVSRPGFGSANLENSAWQIAGGWVITGEDASFTGVVPRRSFNPKEGRWGALQLVLRYSELDVDSAAFPRFADPAVSAGKAQEYAIGLNWYLNRNLRLNTSFSHVEFTGGGGPGSSTTAAVTRNDENVLFTRIQLAF
jgi:phosphate-selective porin OprO/OprP